MNNVYLGLQNSSAVRHRWSFFKAASCGSKNWSQNRLLFGVYCRKKKRIGYITLAPRRHSSPWQSFLNRPQENCPLRNYFNFSSFTSHADATFFSFSPLFAFCFSRSTNMTHAHALRVIKFTVSISCRQLIFSGWKSIDTADFILILSAFSRVFILAARSLKYFEQILKFYLFSEVILP